MWWAPLPLLEDFRKAGFPPDAEDADLVVLGFDTTLTYEKLRVACDLIRAGKPVYGVNPDWNCPVEGGFIPDCGSIAALVRASTGVQCEFSESPLPTPCTICCGRRDAVRRKWPWWETGCTQTLLWRREQP